MMAKQSNLRIKTKTTGGNSIVKWIVVGAIGIIGVAIAIKLIKNFRKTKTGNDVVENENVKIAMELNSYIHPSRNWVGNLFTSADRDNIFALLQSVKDYDTVANEYYKLYNESLSHELQDALGDEYSDALNLLGKAKTGAAIISDSEIGKISDDLFNDMNGLNVFGHSLEPYQSLLRLSNYDFKRVVVNYNSRHDNFLDQIEGEVEAAYSSWLSPALALSVNSNFEDLKQKVVKRYNSLMK
jgi:hypothetical protein